MLSFLSREEWMAQRRTARKGQVSRRLADYATEAEIDVLKAELVMRFKQASGPSAEDVRFKRSCFRQAIARIERDQFPVEADCTEDLIEPFRKRYEAARGSAPSPIDEAEAWSRELQRRAELEARFGSGRPVSTGEEQSPENRHENSGVGQVVEEGPRLGSLANEFSGAPRSYIRGIA